MKGGDQYGPKGGNKHIVYDEGANSRLIRNSQYQPTHSNAVILFPPLSTRVKVTSF